MHKNNRYVIGLMSGTSLDGLDLIYMRFTTEDYSNYEIIHYDTYAYSNEWIQKLKKGVYADKDELCLLDIDFGVLVGKSVNRFIEKFKISNIDFIASHGHTIFHQPEKGITLQVGNGQEIANATGLKVVCDFRTQDVKLGGQGAPLVPIGDKLLFSNYEACLNLGGFANVSYDSKGERIAYDVCPVNIVLNHYAEKLGLAYDESGNMASMGIVRDTLLKELNALTFYQIAPPKSLGYEWVLTYILPLIDGYDLSVRDILRTYVEHIAMQLSSVLKSKSSILVTGGGAFNSFLMERILYHSGNQFETPSKEMIEYKEALIFAFLGLLRIEGKVNCLKSVTGAKRNHSSGVIFNPNNT